jgi:hypothetical protein
MALRDIQGVDTFRRALCLLPTHFGHGLICNSLFPWLAGQDLFVAPPFITECLMRLGRLVDEHKITFLVGPVDVGIGVESKQAAGGWEPAARSLRLGAALRPSVAANSRVGWHKRGF